LTRSRETRRGWGNRSRQSMRENETMAQIKHIVGYRNKERRIWAGSRRSNLDAGEKYDLYGAPQKKKDASRPSGTSPRPLPQKRKMKQGRGLKEDALVSRKGPRGTARHQSKSHYRGKTNLARGEEA